MLKPTPAVLYKSGQFITVVTDKPRSILSSEPVFAEAVAAYKTGDYQTLMDLANRPGMIERYSGGDIKVYDGGVYYKGQSISSYVTKRIMEYVNEGIPLTAIVNFLNDLMQNPSVEVRDDLFRFLEVNDMALTEDGGFLAYKLVTLDGKPIYHDDGHTVYKIGEEVEMKREDCSTSRNECGGAGYYFGNKGYWGNCFDAQNRYTGAGRMLIVKLMPSWIVAIPSAEARTKGRSYKMLVLSEYETIRETVHNNKVVEVNIEDTEEELMAEEANQIIDDQRDAIALAMAAAGQTIAKKKVFKKKVTVSAKKKYGKKPDGHKFYNTRDKFGHFKKLR